MKLRVSKKYDFYDGDKVFYIDEYGNKHYCLLDYEETFGSFFLTHYKDSTFKSVEYVQGGNMTVQSHFLWEIGIENITKL